MSPFLGDLPHQVSRTDSFWEQSSKAISLVLLDRAAEAVGSVTPATTFPLCSGGAGVSISRAKDALAATESTGATHTILYIKFKTEFVNQCRHFAVLKERKDFCCTHNFCFFKFTVQKYGGFVSISDTNPP